MSDLLIHLLLKSYHTRIKEAIEKAEELLPKDIPRQEKVVYTGDLPPIVRSQDHDPRNWRFEKDPEGIPLILLPLYEILSDLEYDVKKAGQPNVSYILKEKD